jgi:hypothetical protein
MSTDGTGRGDVLNRGVVAAAAFALLLAWVAVGIGYHRLELACYESRHAIDQEQATYGDPIGFGLDVAFWPVYLTANGLNGADCAPRAVR